MYVKTSQSLNSEKTILTCGRIYSVPLSSAISPVADMLDFTYYQLGFYLLHMKMVHVYRFNMKINIHSH